MKRQSLFLVVLALLLFLSLTSPLAAQDATPEPVGLRLDAPPYALHGPYWVGTMTMDAQTEFHRTKVQVWFPALNPEGLEEAVTFGEYGLPIYGHALENAAPDAEHGPYPLVIVAHGLNANRLTHLFLCEHLVSYGFIVLAIDYADNWTTPAQTPLSRISSLYTRPRDVSWQIDYAVTLTTTAGQLEGLIDIEHTAVVGHSYGGYTALAAAGAQLDKNGQTSWCAIYPKTTLPKEVGSFNPCSDSTEDNQANLATLAGLDTAPDGLWPSWGDDRVDAIVPLAPGAFDFGSESLKKVTAPTMEMFGSADLVAFTGEPLYSAYTHDSLASQVKSLVVFENASHYFFENDCDAWPWLSDRGVFWTCSDPVWSLDRAHDLINHFTTAFLLDVLKGDPDAHAALLAENVSFPGIEYKTTMK